MESPKYLVDSQKLLVEKVRWKGSEIRHSFLWLVSLYQECFPTLNLDFWMVETSDQFEKARTYGILSPFELQNQAFSLVCNGTGLEETPTQRGELLIWKERNPALRFVDRSRDQLLPSERSKVYKFLNEVGEEAKEVFKLDVSADAFHISWPRSRYVNDLTVIGGLNLTRTEIKTLSA